MQFAQLKEKEEVVNLREGEGGIGHPSTILIFLFITKGAEKLVSKQDTIFQTAKFRRLVNLGVALFTTPI